MKIIELLIINSIIISFPILAYQYFTIYMQNMKREKVSILLSFALLISLYLSLRFKSFMPKDYEFLALILTVIIAYLNKCTHVSIIISVIIGEYLIRDLHYNLVFTPLFFILLFLFYKYYTKTNKDYKFLVKAFTILSIFTYILNELDYLITNPNNIHDIVLSILLFIIIIEILSKALKEANNIINLHMNLKEFEKEKSIKLSLFKITHEIKNPLAVIKGYTDMFDPKNEEKSTKYINVIKSEIDRTLNLLTDFMEFSKIKVDKKIVNFNLLIDDVKDVLIPFFIAKNIKYYFEVEEDIVINIDYLRIKQVILNILKNAVEACTKDIGQVSTTIFKDTESLYIYVQDNGIGMNKDTMDNMLTPFYTTKEKCTGLGVSLSKEIIEAHNGNLSYTSEPNNGTICKITLPLKN